MNRRSNNTLGFWQRSSPWLLFLRKGYMKIHGWKLFAVNSVFVAKYNIACVYFTIFPVMTSSSVTWHQSCFSHQFSTKYFFSQILRVKSKYRAIKVFVASLCNSFYGSLHRKWTKTDFTISFVWKFFAILLCMFQTQNKYLQLYTW